MTINADEYKSIIGVDSLYYALISEDTAAAYTAGTPEILAPVAEIAMKPVSSKETQYADNQPYDVFASEAETDMEMTLTGVPAAAQAAILGSILDVVSGRIFDNGATPPYVAIGFRSMKSNNKYRYYWFQKVQFSPPEEGAVTKADKPTPKTIKLVCKAIKTIYKWDLDGSVTDSVKRVWGDEDTTNFNATSWFSQVQTPDVVAPSALALSSSNPVDGASGVAVSVSPTLTFNNALPSDAVDRVILMKATDHSLVSATITIDTTKKVITIDPTTNLTATTEYYISYAMTDIYGDTLSGVINFTTT